MTHMHGALGMLDTILKFQNGPDLEPTHRQPVFSILVLGTCTGRPRTHRTANAQLRSVSFVDAVTGEVEASICQQIKLFAAYLTGG